MSDFTFSATAECEKCGAYLSESDEDCDHDGRAVHTHVFRKLGEGRDSMVGVESTTPYKWERLEETVDNWICYQYIGPRSSVENMISHGWDSVADLPVQEMATDRLK